MAQWMRILILVLLYGGVVSASGTSVSPVAEKMSETSLPDLASDSAQKKEQENLGKSYTEKSADYFFNSATQGFDNLTPEALESQARSYFQGQMTSSAQSGIESLMSPYGKVRTNLAIGEGGGSGR
jgi:adhesin/invasin